MKKIMLVTLVISTIFLTGCIQRKAKFLGEYEIEIYTYENVKSGLVVKRGYDKIQFTVNGKTLYMYDDGNVVTVTGEYNGDMYEVYYGSDVYFDYYNSSFINDYNELEYAKTDKNIFTSTEKGYKIEVEVNSKSYAKTIIVFDDENKEKYKYSDFNDSEVYLPSRQYLLIMDFARLVYPDINVDDSETGFTYNGRTFTLDDYEPTIEYRLYDKTITFTVDYHGIFNIHVKDDSTGATQSFTSSEYLLENYALSESELEYVKGFLLTLHDPTYILAKDMYLGVNFI